MADPVPPARADADQNLLFGVLALQADVIDRTQFVEACSAWATDKSTSLADVLAARGWLSTEDRADVERLVQRKLKRHAGDAQSSLAEAAGEEVRRTLAGASDPVVRHTLAGLPPTVGASPPTRLTPLADGRDRYRLSRLHSKGGIGQVWLAHDDDLGREVALKELRPEHADNPLVLARFLEEARVTGRLEHPGIVPVYELAAPTGSERPFYTMRFIRGRTLSDACRVYHQRRRAGEAQPLELRALLDDFVVVSNAVAYAHSRGVLHRDLKGANIILGDFGEVMVLDWGLAKTIELQEQSIPTPVPDTATVAPLESRVQGSRDLTLQGQILGTPGYMAPEQAEGRLDRIDQRSDVYGLGAVLYEILTGRPPFEGDDTLAVLRQVINEEPQPPRHLVRETPAALAAICLKALAKDPAGRYSGAAALASDVQHYLADEPVSSYRESPPAQIARWSRRHRALVTGSLGLLVSAAAALAVGVVLLNRANTRTERERDRAEENSAEAERQRRLAEGSLTRAQEAERRAKAAAAHTEAINGFLVNDLLAEASPDRNPRDKHVTVEEVLGRAAHKVDSAFGSQPDVEASVRLTLAETYYRLGQYAAAEPHIRRALELRRRLLGPDHIDTLETLNCSAELAWAAGQVDRAITLGREALERNRRVLGSDSLQTMTAANNLSLALQRQGRLAEAELLCRETLEVRRRLKGPDHPYTLNAQNNLARLLLDEGKAAEAETILRSALAAVRRKLGPADVSITVAVLSNLGVALTELNMPAEAESLLHEDEEMTRRVEGPEHPHTLIIQENLNHLLIRQGRLDAAEPLCRQNLASCRAVFGPAHLKTIVALENLAELSLARGRPADASPFAREVMEARRKSLPPDHPDLAHSLRNWGVCLLGTGKEKDAEAPLRETLAIRQRSLTPGHWLIADAQGWLGADLIAQDRYADAERLLLPAEERMRLERGPTERDQRESVERLVRLYTAWGKPDAAATWRQKLPTGGAPK